MNVTFGVINKTMNDTSHTMSSTITRECKLKENCSRHDPVFIVEGLNKLTRYNYCSWESGYYWIDDLVYITRDIQEVHCHLDPMATFRDSIGNVMGMCVYADESHWKNELDDIRFEPDILYARRSTYVSSNGSGDANLWAWDLTNSTVIVEAIATLADATHKSGYKRYILTYRQFEQVCYNLNCSALDAGVGLIGGGTSYTWQNLVTQAGQDLGKLLCAFGGSGDWHDCIIKATWLPIDATSAYNDAQISSVMPVGAIDMLPVGSTNIRVVDYPVKTWHTHNTLARDDIYPSNGILDDLEFCRNPRWMSIQVKTPGGIQVINDPILREDSVWPLQIYTDIDIITGNWQMQISTNSTKNTCVLAKFSGNISMDLTQYLSNNGTSQSWTSNIVGKAAALYAGGVAAGSAATVSDSVTTTKRTNWDNAKPLLTAAGNPSSHYDMSKGSNTETTTTTHTTGKKSTPMPSMPNIMKEFAGGATSSSIVEYYCFGSEPKLGAQFVLFMWAPHSFTDDADPYEAYKDFCDDYGYPANKILCPNDCTDNSYLQFTNTFIRECPGATYEDKKVINFYLNDGFIWRTTI